MKHYSNTPLLKEHESKKYNKQITSARILNAAEINFLVNLRKDFPLLFPGRLLPYETTPFPSVQPPLLRGKYETIYKSYFVNYNSPLIKGVVQIARGLFRKIPKGVAQIIKIPP